MPEKVVTLIITVDLKCSHCKAHIQKVLCKLQKCEPITEIKFDEKNDTVTVSGTFDPDCLIRKLRCKAGKVIICIEIKPGPKPPPPPPPKPDPCPPVCPCPPPPVCPCPPPPPPVCPCPPPPPPVCPCPPPPPPVCPCPPRPPRPPPPPPPPPPVCPCPCRPPVCTCPPACPPPPPPPEPPRPPSPTLVKVVDWDWPSKPPPWSACCAKPCPCFQPHEGWCRCCSCGTIINRPCPAPLPWPPRPPLVCPPQCGGGVNIVCNNEDPPPACNIM